MENVERKVRTFYNRVKCSLRNIKWAYSSLDKAYKSATSTHERLVLENVAIKLDKVEKELEDLIQYGEKKLELLKDETDDIELSKRLRTGGADDCTSKRRMKHVLTIFAFAILMCGCYHDPNIGAVSPYSQPDSTLNYNVKYLFEVEGVRVYRFYDKGNYIYFTNTCGRTSYDYTRQVAGNIYTTEHLETICNSESEKYEKVSF